jgi:hypothetical protein
MNELVKRMYRRVDLNPQFTPLELDPQLQRRFWHVAYRDARCYAQISCTACDELVLLRGFGPLKKIWGINNCVIGRVRVNDLREFDNYTIAKQFDVQDYNPNRRLTTPNF